MLSKLLRTFTQLGWIALALSLVNSLSWKNATWLNLWDSRAASLFSIYHDTLFLLGGETSNALLQPCNDTHKMKITSGSWEPLSVGMPKYLTYGLWDSSEFTTLGDKIYSQICAITDKGYQTFVQIFDMQQELWLPNITMPLTLSTNKECYFTATNPWPSEDMDQVWFVCVNATDGNALPNIQNL